MMKVSTDHKKDKSNLNEVSTFNWNKAISLEFGYTDCDDIVKEFRENRKTNA